MTSSCRVLLRCTAVCLTIERRDAPLPIPFASCSCDRYSRCTPRLSCKDCFVCTHSLPHNVSDRRCQSCLCLPCTPSSVRTALDPYLYPPVLPFCRSFSSSLSFLHAHGLAAQSCRACQSISVCRQKQERTGSCLCHCCSILTVLLLFVFDHRHHLPFMGTESPFAAAAAFCSAERERERETWLKNLGFQFCLCLLALFLCCPEPSVASLMRCVRHS